MDDKKLQKIQDDLMKGIDTDLDRELSLIDRAKSIATSLSVLKEAREEIDGKVYIFKYKESTYRGQKRIMMTVADQFKFDMLKEKYRPYIVGVEIDNDFDLKQNLTSTVEAFLRHIFDMVEAEELD